MFTTRLTRLLGIEYPIIQGGMNRISRAELAAAVSNAGGLGILYSANLDTEEKLREEIRRTRSLTDKPFGVNINLFPAARPVDTERYIDIAIDEGVGIVETAGRSPDRYMERLKQGGVKVIHKAPGAVKFARRAEKIGCDAVCIVGYESGGSPGFDDTSSLVLVRATADAVKIPVIASGGFVDAQGFVAALALGADGVCMGTRFMATRECPVHPRFKEWLLRANETDAVIVGRTIGLLSRVLKNEMVARVLEMEKEGATLETLMPLISGENTTRVLFEGELDAGIAHCGQCIGLIHDIPAVKEVIDDIIRGAGEVIKNKLNPLLTD